MIEAVKTDEALTLTLHINRDELNEFICRTLSEQLLGDGYSPFHWDMNKEIVNTTQECVKEMIYSQKDKIVDKVVKQATTEIKRRALPILMEKIGE